MRTIQLTLVSQALREAGLRVCERVRAAGGRALAVGGCVRDAALGLPCAELDLEVFGVAPERLEEILARDFGLDRVGRAFSVLKLRGLPIDVSVARRGQGEAAVWAAELTPEQAAARRDFRINAIACDPQSGEVIDPFDGLGDLARGVLRHTSARFGEDPLRVLRAMQLAARFDFAVAPETVALCRALRPHEIPPERIFGEWRKLVLRGGRPSRGLAFLRDCGWVQYTPELAALIGCAQDPAWHPEGDVWVHTLHCMDAFASERVGDEREDLVVGLAVLCHDFGKPETTQRDGGRITSVGHERRGALRARSFLERMTAEHALLETVPPLVAAHLVPLQLYTARAGDAAVRRLARRVGRIDRLVRVARADQRGRPPRSGDFAAGAWLLERARALEVEARAPRPLLRGRHLIALGLPPGPAFGPILERCYRAQLDGAFSTLDEGLAFLRAELARRAPAER
ncbi:MAG: hypothetical protein OEW02_02755 [Myxococcales bacterium]|nr:hypothetical protein [Myxococcales bacterium]